ncbi:UNVERIFIED_CONTAM: hypothetical protein H355_015248 [Colinus virginianus]|nr:hypothetical protein H355_015248 [Colinus virginianus]
MQQRQKEIEELNVYRSNRTSVCDCRLCCLFVSTDSAVLLAAILEALLCTVEEVAAVQDRPRKVEEHLSNVCYLQYTLKCEQDTVLRGDETIPPTAARHSRYAVLSRSQVHAALRTDAECADAASSSYRPRDGLVFVRHSNNVRRKPNAISISCTTTTNRDPPAETWASCGRRVSTQNASRGFLFTATTRRTNQRRTNCGRVFSRKTLSRNGECAFDYSYNGGICTNSSFTEVPSVSVQRGRWYATMAASTQDNSYQQLADEARSYVHSQKLGAFIDGHWIAHDADPSHFPQRLLQLLQHPQRAHPQEHFSDQHTPQQTGPPHQDAAQHSTYDTVPVSALSLTSFEVKDPATGDMVCLLPALHTPYIRAAVAAAARAQHTVWAPQQAPPAQRHHVLKEWERLVKAEKESLARVLVLETGKPLPEARAEILYASSFIGWFAEQLRRDNGVLIPSPGGTQALMAAYRQPVGVCALITPWNMPAAMLTRKASAALAAGCCCVCKLPADAPLTALCFGRLAERAGVPAGVLNLVTSDHKGARMFAEEVSRHAVVRKISFTGSTRVGKLLMQQAAMTMKRVSLELGGNAPFIIFEDADIDEAVQALVACKFRNAGQTCVCANRVYVHRDIWDKFVPPLVKLVRELVVGHGFVHGVSVGPLINKGAREKVERLVAQSVALGGRLLCPVDAAAFGTVRKDSQGDNSSALKAAEQLLRAIRSSLPEHLRGSEECSFFPPVVMDCRAFDGLELEALRGVVRKDMRVALAAGAQGGERLTKRDTAGILPQFSSRSTLQQQGEDVHSRQEREEELYPEILQMEIFGPVLPLYSFSDEAEVVRRANSTKVGLAAYFCTRDLYRVPRVSAALEAGLVGVNTGIISTVEAPFGGIKESGMGREGSIYGLDEYTELKYVCVGGGTTAK